MNRLRRTFSFRKRKKQNKSEAGDSSKPQQWLDDEVKIKEGFCSFQVKVCSKYYMLHVILVFREY